MGVKQGCILSPILFSIYIDDICEALTGGVLVGEAKVKALLYADDIVLLASSPQALQMMISQLEAYCELWNLIINLDKSKVMIFGKGGGRRGKKEIWHLHGKVVEVVNKYNYLGITLTSQLAMKTHMVERLTMGKQGIHALWSELFCNKYVPLSAKIHVFEAVSRAVMSYGCQVWGFQKLEEVEKLQRFFIKKILKLPSCTPDYMLYLETGAKLVFVYTLRLHFKFMSRVFEMPNERLPKIIAKEVAKENIFWAKEWQLLGDKRGLNRNLIDSLVNYKTIFIEQSTYLLQKIIDQESVNNILRAQTSTFNEAYRWLNSPLGNSGYFHDKYSIECISWIFKMRCGLMGLNSSPMRNGSSLCSLCNLNSEETIFHFLATCPILAPVRKQFFGKSLLSFHDAATILNGLSWRNLHGFAIAARKLRMTLVSEFNY